MEENRWSEFGSGYKLVHPKVCGQLDPAKPGRGLHELQFDSEILPYEIFGVRWLTRASEEAKLGGVSIPPCCDDLGDRTGRGGCVLRDCWTCGRDLLAEYVPQVGEEASLTIRWRILSPIGPGDDTSVGVEVLFSLQTLESALYQRLCLTSLLPTRDLCVFVLQGDHQSSLVRFDGTENPPAEAAVVTPLVPGQLWYQEMGHPHDVHAWGLVPGSGSAAGDCGSPERASSRGNDAPQTCRTWYRLFAAAVEKGIIFRARVRGVFHIGNVDPEKIKQTWAEFLSLPLPLGD